MTSKRAHIEALLDALDAAVPDSAGLGLARLREDMAYTAPELMDTTWLRVRAVLVCATRNNPVWATQASDIWNKAATAYPAD
jgi:hypothetical protein